MKVVLFAGGVGSRLWPLSRKNSPKQFGNIIGDKSMLQIAVQKLFPTFEWSDVFISTGKQYAQTVREQLSQLPAENVIVEPEMRDVGPAVGLITALFVKSDPNEPIALLWGSDHLVREEELFRKLLKTAEGIVKEDGQRIVFLAQKPRFANQNLGYIEFSDQVKTIDGISVYKFSNLHYRPELEKAKEWVKDGKHSWNLGYFVTTPSYLWKLFEEFSPDLFEKLKKIHDAIGTPDYERVLEVVYPSVEKISFDNAILEKMDPNSGFVLSEDLGWSDVGAWEALKEALSDTEEENVTKGNVLIENTQDSLVFNYNEQLVVGIDLQGMVVVNTGDVLLICPKDSVPKIKEIVSKLSGTKHEHLA